MVTPTVRPHGERSEMGECRSPHERFARAADLILLLRADDYFQRFHTARVKGSHRFMPQRVRLTLDTGHPFSRYVPYTGFHRYGRPWKEGNILHFSSESSLDSHCPALSSSLVSHGNNPPP